MLDPALAFQTAVRGALVVSPAITALVEADMIRAGATRHDRTPAVTLTDARTEYLGRASGSQRMARVFLTLHIWAREDGQEVGQEIGAAVYEALEFGPPDSSEIAVDEWQQPRLVWLRDPKPEMTLTHGVMSLEAVVRWKV